MQYLKLNLQVVQLNPGSDYRLDPNAFVIPGERAGLNFVLESCANNGTVGRWLLPVISSSVLS